MSPVRPHGDTGQPAHNEGAAPPRAGFGATLRAVLWSFIGVRRRHDYDRDARSLDPRAVVVAGLLGGLVFVLAIVAVVHFVVRA